MNMIAQTGLICLLTTSFAWADEGWTELLPAGSLEAWKSPHHAWAYVSGVHLKEGNPKLLDRDEAKGRFCGTGRPDGPAIS